MRGKMIVSLFAATLLLGGCESTGDGSGGATGQGQQTATAPTSVTIQEDRLFFDTDRSDLKPAARSAVETWAGWMKANPAATVTIAGHADERGTREYNLALGDRRANSAKNYLVALGVNPNRVRTISYGKERPAEAGHTETIWSKNRRAVFGRN